MNLRQQFVILIVSVFAIPFFILGMSFYIFSSTMYPSDPRVVAEDLFTGLDDVESIDKIAPLFETIDDSYTGIILNKKDLEVIGNLSDLTIENPTVIVDSQTHLLPDNQEVVVLLGVSLVNEDSIIFPMIFLLSSLIPLILIPLLIIRSINNSIRKLESATEKIAQGNLDFELSTKRNDQIGSLAISMNDMRKQLKEEKDRRNRFYMGVSHDLMTPLAHISGFSEALLEGLSSNEEMTERYLNIINSKAELMEKRIRQLLEYLQYSEMEFQNQLEERDIGAFLKDFLTALEEEQSFHKREVEWQLDLSEQLIVSFNETLLNRALENLIQNSFRYGDNEHPVQIHISQVQDDILISIKNRGNAIPEKELQYIFEPFYRVDKSRRNKGFGLGLSAVKSIIDSHGWEISASSDDELTEFCIIIPL